MRRIRLFVTASVFALVACAEPQVELEATLGVNNVRVTLPVGSEARAVNFLFKCSDDMHGDTACRPRGREVRPAHLKAFGTIDRIVILDDGSTAAALADPAMSHAATPVYVRWCKTPNACITVAPNREEWHSADSIAAENVKRSFGILRYGESVVDAFFTLLHIKQLLRPPSQETVQTPTGPVSTVCIERVR